MPARPRTTARRASLRSSSLISEPFDFAPSTAALAAATRELDDLGRQGGGAVDALSRRRALDAYLRFGREEKRFPQRWRHDYAALPFDELSWSSGRMAVPATQIAAGLVHAGSIYLEPPAPAGDPRILLAALADAAQAVPDRVAAVSGHIVPFNADRFTALATAFQNCGAFVDVPEGVVLDDPVQLVWTSRAGTASAVFPHTVVRLGPNARATIVERHLGEAESFVCGIVEADLGPGAHLNYVVIQQADEGARILFRRGARCAAGATAAWHVAEVGGALARTALDLQLEGARARGDANALFFANGFANVDLAVDVGHDAAETESQTIVRGAATDRGHGRFAGDIRVAPDAHACRASMRDDALVLSRDAYLEAVPALAIGAHDVAVSHAATVGSLDEEQLFYVQSRGVARTAAERMVALAFFEPAIARFPSDALREEVRSALDARLEEVPDTFAS
jgi:Fe-S cluster assembly protein SufD